jgi:hypothetical protein
MLLKEEGISRAAPERFDPVSLLLSLLQGLSVSGERDR